MASLPSSAAVELINDEASRPSPTTYLPLLPTLQIYVGMVTDGGDPRSRVIQESSLDAGKFDSVSQLAASVQAKCRLSASEDNNLQVRRNLDACSLPVTKNDLIDYIEHAKRIDIEQAVAMVISYLTTNVSSNLGEEITHDEFETEGSSPVQELLADPGTIRMLAETCMWREAHDFNLLDDAREIAIEVKKAKILRILGESESSNEFLSTAGFMSLLQTVRRRRGKLDHSQHLVFPSELLGSAGDSIISCWGFQNSYRHEQQTPVATTAARVIPKIKFRAIHNLLGSMCAPTDKTSAYVFDVEKFIKKSGRTSPRRLAALRASTDPFAIAFSFIAAQRRMQLKVVSDHAWSRFLIPGEGKLLLQNRPDVLTSFEDILVRHASDLTALTAIACPKGIRDHFSSEDEIRDRVLTICEFMERYVKDFGDGDMSKLVFQPDVRGGSGRGPVDVYNALCDELRDCRARAKGAGLELNIGPVHKFLAKDIMYWNNGWADDAFAGGKIPGWVEYLAHERDEFEVACVLIRKHQLK